MIIYEDLERLGTWAGSGSRSRSGSDAKPSIEKASKHVQDRAGGAPGVAKPWFGRLPQSCSQHAVRLGVSRMHGN